MKSRSLIVSTLIAFVATLAHAGVKEGLADSNESKVENFRLIDHTGRSIELYRSAEAPAVVLYTHGVGCPVVRRSIPELNRLREKYGAEGVVFYMLNANSQDTRADLAEEAEEFGITFPVLKDPTQRIVHALGSTRTAEALVLDPQADWKVLYRGPVDDRFDYGTQKAEASHHWLEDVLQAKVAGKPVVPHREETKGCLIGYAEEKPLSYSKDVAPILASNCVTCHRKGGIGPFAMTNYKKVKGWSDMIRETLRTKRMPPWHADPAHNSFHNSIDITSDERRILLTWIEQGAKQDEGASDPLAELALEDLSEWTLGTPDHIVQIPEAQHLPAEGIFEYRYITVPSGLTEDKWMTGVEVLPTAMEVVHHALIFIMYPPQYRHLEPDAKGGLNGFFASYLPSGNLQPFPKGTAQFVPAGSAFVFQMHYNATGKPEVDQTRMGLHFRDGPPEHVFHIKGAAETDFEIPPGASDYATRATYRFREDATVYGLSPHMHYRGSRFSFEARYPDESKETLLSVPWYEFDWQPMYFFDSPVKVVGGTRIVCEGAFDNSTLNPRNPDPTKAVHFGEQTHEEMFIGYVSYSQPYRAEDFQAAELNPDQWPGFGKTLTEEYLTGTTWSLGDRFQLRFEADGKLVIGDRFQGTWRFDGDTVHVETPRRNFELKVLGDALTVRGRPLMRVPGPAKSSTDPA